MITVYNKVVDDEERINILNSDGKLMSFFVFLHEKITFPFIIQHIKYNKKYAWRDVGCSHQEMIKFGFKEIIKVEKIEDLIKLPETHPELFL